MKTNTTGGPVSVRALGGPTVLIEYGGLRFLTDPTFDGPGTYRLMPGLTLTKTDPAPIAPASLGPIDAVLLSHHQHPDNLDGAGRVFLSEAPVTLTTLSGAAHLAGTARAVTPWESIELDRPDGGTVTVTGTPALHGPEELGTENIETVAGEVIGFVLTADDLPTVYVSGDNASLLLVERIAERFAPVDTAVLFAGAARVPVVFNGALLTLDSVQAAEAARILRARRAVIVHCEGWAHFTEGRAEVVKAFAEAELTGLLQDDGAG
ncbi:L-ascorbate metabolism protein UlaG (beta-lactamase superfamily) [Actinocorallia herbida]|uniref:L-ascorbate metabolism protein UlaG (Beta-lactamase superfamily) n=1 Tax=Actinocorallia herbida TaxID=58109 RepID=A0A3N1CU85_9ACTN|nr:MBL fold metallo-hydrolase [Actinocorallia herbida]ROO84867.1 L-ascorbate metabolism protein UlaG (beta-lactamase superfamily) [Actinocorallia herbida]